MLLMLSKPVPLFIAVLRVKEMLPSLIDQAGNIGGIGNGEWIMPRMVLAFCILANTALTGLLRSGPAVLVRQPGQLFP